MVDDPDQPVKTDLDNQAINMVGGFLNAGLALGAMNAAVDIAGQAGNMVQQFFGGNLPETVGTLNGGTLPAALQPVTMGLNQTAPGINTGMDMDMNGMSMKPPGA